jgi:hypothetical protein
MGVARRRAEGGGCEQGEGDQYWVCPVDPDDVGVGEQVGGEAFPVGPLAVEQPAAVRVEQAFGQAARGGAVAPWGVRVAVPVGVGVVAAVVGDPLDHLALQRERARDRQGDAEPPCGFE